MASYKKEKKTYEKQKTNVANNTGNNHFGKYAGGIFNPCIIKHNLH